MKRVLFLFLIAASTSGFAQTLTSVEYSMGFGTGNMKEFITPASFRGFTFDLRKMVQPNVGVGIELGWNVFYDELSNDVYSIGNVSYSGKQYRYDNKFPMLVSADYYFKPGEQINPFVGFGLGTVFSMRTTDMGQYRFEDEGWHFAIKPEAGVLIEVNPSLGVSLTAKYYYGFETSDFGPQGYFALNFGLVFMN